jgi:hypothetical protein
MSTEWQKTSARDVKVGDRVRVPNGTELLVGRIESPFLGRDGMLAFVEDTSERWFKQPLPVDTPVEVVHSAS